MSDKYTGQELVSSAEKLFNTSERKIQEAKWSELAEFLVPTQNGRFNENTAPTTPNMRRVFDSTGELSNRLLASNLSFMLVNPAIKWFKNEASNPDVRKDSQAMKWLDKNDRQLWDVFLQSNFYEEANKVIRSLTTFGNAAIFHDELDGEDPTGFSGFNFRAIHLAELAWLSNHKGRVDHVVRKFQMTGHQVLSRWEDSLPEEIERKLELNPSENVDIIHCLYMRKKPRTDVLAAPDQRPVASVYVLRENGHILEEGGYFEFPVYVIRDDLLPGQEYGCSFGHLALPNVRTVNVLQGEYLKAIPLAIRPPNLTEQRNLFGSLDLRPGAVNTVRDISKTVPYTTGVSLDAGQLGIMELRNSIERCFLLDKLLLPPRNETGEMTAFEIATRTEEIQRVLGPTLSRINHEFLEPLIRRSYKMLLRAGVFSSPPPIFNQTRTDIKITFENLLARSQKIEDITSTQQWLQDITAIAQLNPDAIDILDVDGALRHGAQVRGVPSEAIKDEQTVESIRQQRQEAAAQQTQIEQGVMQADIQSKTQPPGV